ncbi:MAG: TnpV protein [Clostridiales bacterium]|nr:TnpV protein [Clostridiales bacterium]
MKEITYRREGDIQLPDLIWVEPPVLNKYGRMRYNFLKEHLPAAFHWMWLEETLYPHCLEIQQTAERRMELMMKYLQENDPPPDKASDQMGWAAHMNTLRAAAEETLNELLYSLI